MYAAQWPLTRKSGATILLTVATALISLLLVMPISVAGQCVVTTATTQPVGPPSPPGGGTAPLPNAAVYRPGTETFYMLYNQALMDGLEGGPIAGAFGQQTSTKTDGNGQNARFESLFAGVVVEPLNALFVLDRTYLRKVALTTRDVTTLLDSPLIKTNSRMATNGTHVFITSGSCIVVANVGNATVRLFDFIGSCTEAKTGLVTSPQSLASTIPGATVITASGDMVLFFVQSNQFLFLPPDRAQIAPATQYVGSPDVLVSGADYGAFVDGSCAIQTIRMGSSGVVTFQSPSVQNAPSDCSVGGEFIGMRIHTDTTDKYTIVNKNGKALTVTGCASTNGNTTTAAPNSTSASAAASSTSDKQPTIIIAAVVSAVVVLGIIVAILVIVLVLRKKENDANGGPKASEEMTEQQPGTAAASPNLGLTGSTRGITPIVVAGNGGGGSAGASAEQSNGTGGTLSTSMVTIPTFASANDTHNEPVASNSLRKSQNPSQPMRSMDDSTTSNHNLSSSSVVTTKLDPANYSSPEVYKRDVRRIRNVESGQFQKGKLIGRGANGAVYSVLLKDGSTIAMKEVSLMGNEQEMQSMVDEITREHRLLSQLHHPNLVKYYGVAEDTNAGVMRLFMENVTGGALGGMVRGMSTRLAERPARKFTYQITAGLAFIHSKGIVHRDLKCDNILRDANTGDAKLADFGTAKNVGMASRAASTMIGTPYFMAPEILMPAMMATEGEDGVGYGAKADVWSLGILVAEMMNQGNPPWPAFPSPGHAFLYIANPDNKPDIPEGLSDAARAFIARCTQRDPRLRPTAAELLSDPWLQGAEDNSDNESDEG